MISAVLAATITFTATATGVEKGAPVEFVFADRSTDRAYESMFLIDEPVDGLCNRLEEAGLPCGTPCDAASCNLWPSGCTVSFEPALTNYIDCASDEKKILLSPVYTGGTRHACGKLDAATNMPASVFSTYTLSQSPIVPNGIIDQGSAYGLFTARLAMKKGNRVTFRISWNASSLPRRIHLTAAPDNSVNLVKTLRQESEKGVVEALIGFADDLTVREATAVASALAAVDSPQVRINGCTNVFYRAFLPLTKWLDRKERLVQPFELTLGTPDQLVFVEEDWNVESDDPKLTPRIIPFCKAREHSRTDTCFIFAKPMTRVGEICNAMGKLKDANIRSWYVFAR